LGDHPRGYRERVVEGIYKIEWKDNRIPKEAEEGENVAKVGRKESKGSPGVVKKTEGTTS